MISARHPTTRIRSLAALVLVTGIVASLAACSSDPASVACDGVPSGDASSLVTATGDFGAEPKVEFPTPLITQGRESSVVSAGDGEYLRKGDYADIQYSIWDGQGGGLVDESYGSTGLPRAYVGADGGLSKFLDCAEAGSRIATTATASELFGGNEAQLQLESDATVVLVIDVLRRIPGKADGTDQLPQAGFPSVVTAPDGTPGVTIPNQAPPTTLKSTVLKAGGGEVVKEGDVIAIQYEGLTWDSPGTVFHNSFTGSGPESYRATQYTGQGDGSLFPGTADAIIGQKVGSQVLIVVPKKFSYPADAGKTDGAGADVTRIYVVDILAVID